MLRLPAVADKTFLITIGDRTVGGLSARDQMVGPWQVPVADVRGDADGLRHLSRRGDGDGRAHAARADRRRRPRAAWRSARRSPTSPPRRIARHRRRQALRQLDGRGRPSRARTPRSTTRCARSALELCPRSASASRSARTRCRCARRGARTARDKAVTAPLSLIVSAFAPVADVRAHAHAAAAHRSRRDRAAARRPRRRPQPPRRLGAGAGLRPARRRGAGPRRSPQRLKALLRTSSSSSIARAGCSPITTAPTAACS